MTESNSKIVAVIPAHGWMSRESDTQFAFPLIAWVFREDGTIDAISTDGTRPGLVDFEQDTVEPIEGWRYGGRMR